MNTQASPTAAHSSHDDNAGSSNVPLATASDSNRLTLNEILSFRYKNDSVCLSASNIAAMAGFHPYASLPQLLLKLVYQSRRGQALLVHDTRLVHTCSCCIVKYNF